MQRHISRGLSLFTAAVGVAAAVGAALVLSEQNAIVATNGISMEPVYHQGDLVVVQRRDAYRPGEIVAYRRTDKHLVVLHRIIGGGPAGYVFKGDNNTSTDPTRPTQNQLIGRAVLHIPSGGVWLHRVTAPPLLAAGGLLALIAGGQGVAGARRRRRRSARPGQLRHGTLWQQLQPPLRGIATGAAVLGLGCLVVSLLAWTRPTSQAVAITVPDSSTMSFSYTAPVARSAAYDGTIVTAPQPVFRRVTKALDVTYRYAGRPGRLTVSALLETSNGWSSRVPLGEASVGSSHRGSVRLDLPGLERRAAAPADVIGLPAGQLTVAVVTALHFEAGGSFAPRLELVLDALAVKPRGALSASSPLAVVSHRRAPGRLSVMGRSVDVRTGRTAGGVGVGIAALLLVLCGVLARLGGPTGRAERLHARYRDLILPVMPMTLDAGQAVVDVPDVASLARLADRYGVLILQWAQAGRHTLVVEAEGRTFVCRHGANGTATRRSPHERHLPLRQTPAPSAGSRPVARPSVRPACGSATPRPSG
jgi:signal peptidase I